NFAVIVWSPAAWSVIGRIGIAGGISRASSHCLPHLRFRYDVGVHRARHDHANVAVARRVWRTRGVAHPDAPAITRHPVDLVYARLYHRDLSARMRGRGQGDP